MKKLITLFLIVLLCQSCDSKVDKQKRLEIEKSANTAIIASPEDTVANKYQEVYKDTFVFEGYNDNGDYMWLHAKKGKALYAFVNDNNMERNLLRGDVCEIEWKKDTIYIAGDGETPQIENWLVHIKKSKNGTISNFRKDYNKKIKYHWFDENNYDQQYLDEIYVLAEYYIANSKNELIKNAIEAKNQIEYSIELRTEDNIDYDVLGIGYTFEHRFSVMQWIYIDRQTRQIYNYDLPNEKLIAFE